MSSKAKFRIFIGILIALTVVLIFAFIVYTDQVLDALTLPSDRHSGGLRIYRAVRNHVRTHGTSEVTLGELTNFEWDYALVFTTGASVLTRSDISKMIGCDFSGMISPDTCGILFIYNNEIVYYETHTFTTRNFGDTMPPRLIIGFSLFLREEIGLQTRYSIFGRSDAFLAGINEASSHKYHWMHDVGNGDVIRWS